MHEFDFILQEFFLELSTFCVKLHADKSPWFTPPLSLVIDGKGHQLATLKEKTGFRIGELDSRNPAEIYAYLCSSSSDIIFTGKDGKGRRGKINAYFMRLFMVAMKTVCGYQYSESDNARFDTGPVTRRAPIPL